MSSVIVVRQEPRSLVSINGPRLKELSQELRRKIDSTFDDDLVLIGGEGGGCKNVSSNCSPGYSYPRAHT